MQIGKETVIAVEGLAILHGIVEDKELWAKKGEKSIKTIGIQETI